MPPRPDPMTFIQYTYNLAIASAAVISAGMIAFMLSSIPFLRFLSAIGQVIWLGLVTSAAGSFFAFAARSDLKGQALPEDLKKKLATGWRFNLILLVLMMAITLLTLISGVSDLLSSDL